MAFTFPCIKQMKQMQSDSMIMLSILLRYCFFLSKPSHPFPASLQTKPPSFDIMMLFIFYTKKKLRSGWRKPFLEEKENFMIHFYICGSSRGGGVYDKTLYRIAIFAFHCTLIQLSSSFYYFITFVEDFRAFFIHEKVDILKV